MKIHTIQLLEEIGWRSLVGCIVYGVAKSRTRLSDFLFIIGDWNAKVGTQETPGVTGTFGLGIGNEAGQRLIEFCQENTLVIANTLFQLQLIIPGCDSVSTYKLLWKSSSLPE